MKCFYAQVALVYYFVVAVRTSERICDTQTARSGDFLKECIYKTTFIGNASRVHPYSWIPVVPLNETRKYHPSENRWWGTANNMCVSSIRGVWFKEKTPREHLPSFKMYWQSTSDYGVRRGLLPNTTWLTGITWYANCFKQKPGTTHLNHYMMGIARIFAHFGSARAPDNIVLHHCANLLGTAPKRDITRAIWNYGIAHGYLSPETNIITIPYTPKKWPRESYCMTTVEYPAFPSDPNVLTSKKVADSFHDAMGITPPAHINSAAILVRTGGTSLRRFTNINEVVKVVAAVFGTADIISVNASMTLQAQVSMLTSYRFLVTPHGSHITALYFTRKPPIVLEVVATCLNRHWSRFTIICEAGRPVDSSVALLRPGCNARTQCSSTPNCTQTTLTRLKNSNLHVDLNIFQKGVQQSADLIFDAKTNRLCHQGFKYSPFCVEPNT